MDMKSHLGDAEDLWTRDGKEECEALSVLWSRFWTRLQAKNSPEEITRALPVDRSLHDTQTQLLST